MRGQQELLVVNGAAEQTPLETKLRAAAFQISVPGMGNILVVPTGKVIDLLAIPVATFYRKIEKLGIPTLNVAKQGSTLPLPALLSWLESGGIQSSEDVEEKSLLQIIKLRLESEDPQVQIAALNALTALGGTLQHEDLV